MTELEHIEILLKELRSLEYTSAYKGSLGDIQQISCIPMYNLTQLIGKYDNKRKQIIKDEAN